MVGIFFSAACSAEYDIVIFDPATVVEGSSYKATVVMAGVLIRFPVEDRPHFVAATQEQWQDKMLVDGASMSPRTN